MRVGAIVQARMTSQRLPGKVLADVAGKPLLEWLLERLEHAKLLDTIVVATSDDASDDPVAWWCGDRGTPCERGPLADVAARLVAAAQAHGLEGFARVNGDSPLLDQALVDQGVELMRASGADLVTNVRPRTFPPGQSVEVVRTAALARALELGMTAEDAEHVTGPLYDEDIWRVVRFEAESPRTEPPLTVDTPEDRDRIAELLERLDRPHWEVGWEDLL